VKQGTMVDATTIEAPRGRPRSDGTTTRDQDASFPSKHGVPHHGYKRHLNADLSGGATDSRFGTATEHDPDHTDDLTMHEERPVLAGSTHSSATRRAELRARGVIGGICCSAGRGSTTGGNAGTAWCQGTEPAVNTPRR
jgi:hypothetical protein